MAKNGNGFLWKVIGGIIVGVVVASVLGAIAGSTASKINDAVTTEAVKEIKKDQAECEVELTKNDEFHEKITESNHKAQQAISNIELNMKWIADDILEQKEIDKEQTQKLNEQSKTLNQILIEVKK